MYNQWNLSHLLTHEGHAEFAAIQVARATCMLVAALTYQWSKLGQVLHMKFRSDNVMHTALHNVVSRGMASKACGIVESDFGGASTSVLFAMLLFRTNVSLMLQEYTDAAGWVCCATRNSSRSAAILIKAF